MALVTDIDAMVVGLHREAEILAVALEQGCHTVLEGPPGTGKSTLLRSIAGASGRGVQFVEGNAELTPARLIGAHDPALVLDGGYTPEAWTDGPLLNAMRSGELLYLEELNRIPEETLNVLITAMAEREVVVPRLGPDRGGGRLRARRGDESVRRDRHRARQPVDRRPHVPDRDRLPRRAARARGRPAADGPRGSTSWRSRSRSRAAAAPTRRCGSAPRFAARSTWSAWRGGLAAVRGEDPTPSAAICSMPRSPRCRVASASTRTRAARPRR